MWVSWGHKPDYGLASFFQLGFDIDPTLLRQWFGDKYSFDADKILIVQFFEFQYGNQKTLGLQNTG